MPDTNQTRRTQETPGDAPDSIIFAELFAALTPLERAQVMAYMASLRHRNTA